MKLESYYEEIEREKRHIEKEVLSSENVIRRWERMAIEEHAKLSVGDIVQIDKRKYRIAEKPKIGLLDIGEKKPICDLVYIGVRLKPDGKPYHHSQSSINRREIWQISLEKGITTKVSG